MFSLYRENTEITFQSAETKDGLVHISLVMPQVLLNTFSRLLKTLTEFTEFLSMKTENARIEENIQEKINSVEYKEEVRKKQEEYLKQAIEIFDSFLFEGMPVKEAIKATNRVMKDVGLGGAYYEGTLEAIRKAGGLRKNYKPNER